MWHIDSDNVARNEFGESIWLEQRVNGFYVQRSEWRNFRNGRALLQNTVASVFQSHEQANDFFSHHVDYLNLKHLPIRELYHELRNRKRTKMHSLFTGGLKC